MRALTVLVILVLISYFFVKAKEQESPRNIVVDLPEEITIATDKDSFKAALVGDTLFITFKNKNHE